jgi:hypothetical protein
VESGGSVLLLSRLFVVAEINVMKITAVGHGCAEVCAAHDLFLMSCHPHGTRSHEIVDWDHYSPYNHGPSVLLFTCHILYLHWPSVIPQHVQSLKPSLQQATREEQNPCTNPPRLS